MNSKMSENPIVISGVSGRFPKARNLTELKYNLYNKIDMLTESKGYWKPMNGLPPRLGLLSDVDKFDSMYFGINHNQVESMDPALRILLELCIEAIFDAGLNPSELRDTRTNVYVGNGTSESTHYNMYNKIYSDLTMFGYVN